MLVPPVDTIRLCDDKVNLGNYLEYLGMKRPQPITDPTEFPVFIKSRFGSGSLFAHKVNDQEELSFWRNHIPEPVVQEFIAGQEYTVNMVSDKDAKVVGVLPIRRMRIRGGLSVLTESERIQELEDGCVGLATALGLVGVSNIQAIVKDGVITYIEVNPRFASGSMPTAVASGLDIPLIMLGLMLGDDIGEIVITEGVRLCRYWSYGIVKGGGI